MSLPGRPRGECRSAQHPGNPASTPLADYQDAFARALFAPVADASGSIGASTAAAGSPSAPETVDAAVARLAAQRGFAVYRNTVLKGAVDAIEANYPAVTRLVGSEWLRAAASAFARAQPPAEPSLLHYGAGFADFLARFAPAVDMPWLADVARLDRAWTEAHVAADEPPVAAADVAALAPAELARTVLRPHATARWHVAAHAPILTLWRRNRASAADVPDADVGRDLDWRGEGALLTRPRDVVDAVALDAAGGAFLDACAARGTLAEAAAAALVADSATDLARLMAKLLGAGAFGHLELLPESTGNPAGAHRATPGANAGVRSTEAVR